MTRISEIELPATLVAAARAGEAKALEAVYTATAGAIYTLLRRLVRRPAIAEELLQETFVGVPDRNGSAPIPAHTAGSDRPNFKHHRRTVSNGTSISRSDRSSSISR